MVAIKGGDKFQSAVNALFEGAPKGVALEVGFMANATYPDGTSVAAVAAFNEYGVPSHGQPPRPFFREAIEKRSEAWVHNLGVALQRTKSFPAALALVGQGMQEDIQKSIRNLRSPPIKPATAKRKGSKKPLIDTGFMLRSVTNRIVGIEGDKK